MSKIHSKTLKTRGNIIVIQYDKKKLHTQFPAIRESQITALKKLWFDAFKKGRGIRAHDAPEVVKLAFPLISVRQDVQFLINSIADNASLEIALRRLLEIAGDQPNDVEEIIAAIHAATDPIDRFLVDNWISDGTKDLSNQGKNPFASPEHLYRTSHEQFHITTKALQKSLCLFSNTALAKLIDCVLHQRTPPCPPVNVGPNAKLSEIKRSREDFAEAKGKFQKRIEALTILLRQRRVRLGLLQAKPHYWKDFEFKAGRFHFVPFGKICAKP